VEEEFMGGVKKESQVVLWTNSATRCRVMGAGMARPRGRHHVFEVPKIWQRRILCGRRSGTRDSSLLEKREDELVWMQRKRGAEWRASKRLERHSKGGESGAQSGEPESTAREGGSQQEVRRTFKMLREVWLNIGVEKIDTHEGVVIKALLDSGATGMFMDRQTAARHRFKLQKLERPLVVRNVDGTNNSGGAITHQVECNVFYKGHMERMRMDVCGLGKTEVILGMPWLAAHNPEINWETEEVKMTRCPPLYGRKSQKKEKVKRVATEKEKKIVCWAIDNKEDWGREEEMEEDHRKIEEMVPKKFLKWKKVFGKVE